jgi:hypothetical protein
LFDKAARRIQEEQNNVFLDVGKIGKVVLINEKLEWRYEN